MRHQTNLSVAFTIILIFACLILTTCGRNGTSETSDSNRSDSLSEPVVVLHTLPSGDWFTARCEVLCDEEQGKFIDHEKLEKYGKYKPYDITEQTRKDSSIIAFDFIDDCCMGFAGGAHVRNDTLILEYQPPHDSLTYGCDCYCDYRMTYRIDRKAKTWSAVTANYKR